jgi:hypothetical protein
VKEILRSGIGINVLQKRCIEGFGDLDGRKADMSAKPPPSPVKKCCEQDCEALNTCGDDVPFQLDDIDCAIRICPGARCFARSHLSRINEQTWIDQCRA